MQGSLTLSMRAPPRHRDPCRRRAALATMAAVLLIAGSAAARPAATGPYAEIGFGGTRFIRDQHRNAAIGLAGEAHVGTDLFSWLSVGGRVGLSTHEATVPAPPVGEYFQLYHAAAEVRLAVRVSWLELFASGSVGAAMLSSNILEKVGVQGPGERFSSIITAGGGVEYQLQNRHYAFGLGGEWATMPGFARTQTVSIRGYLRYTY